MNIGYIRVSTTEQNTDRQYAAFKAAGVEIEQFYEDKESGKNMDRKALKEMLKFVRKGDTVHVESISRLGRSLQDLIDIIEQFNQKGVQFRSLKESKIDTTSPAGLLIFNIFAVLSEFERGCIKERQAEGIAAAKAAGKRLGRPAKAMPKGFPAAYKKWKAGEATAAATWRILGLTKSTFYKLAKEYEENTENGKK